MFLLYEKRITKYQTTLDKYSHAFGLEYFKVGMVMMFITILEKEAEKESTASPVKKD